VASDAGPSRTAADWAVAGVAGPLPRGAARDAAWAVRTSPDSRVRAAALGALVRRAGARRTRAAWRAAASDPDAGVRRRAAELAPDLGDPPCGSLVSLLCDADPLVADAAAWALGELGEAARGAVGALCRLATDHADPLVREAAVASLGAIGDPRGLPAILTATTDKPAIRRRAVLALASFEGPDVDVALARATEDRDWQVRDAVRALLEGQGG